MFKKNKYFRGLSLKFSPYFLERLINAIAIVMIWRGVWDLLDTYLLPGHPLLSDILSILIGLAVLYLPDGNIKELM